MNSDGSRKQLELTLQRLNQAWIAVDRLKERLKTGQFPTFKRQQSRQVPSYDSLRKRLDALTTIDESLLAQIKEALRR